MAMENALFKKEREYDEDSFDFNDLEVRLQNQLDLEFLDLDLLESEKEKIGNLDHLGETIKDIVWKQFTNQIAVTAGEDFIKENNGLNLDLRNEAHIQTTENFKNGNLASHNTKINYQERYEGWQSNFVKDEHGNTLTHPTRSGKNKETLVKDARVPFDKGRPTGSKEKRTDVDHTVSAAEIIRDPMANAHMTKKEQLIFANSDSNLNEMDSSLNRSKSDKSTSEWLDNPNANGQKPNQIFDISQEDEKKLRQKDIDARKDYENQKEQGKKKSIETGKKSQKEEAFKITGKALRAVIMNLLADLVKEIIGKLVKWFKSSEKSPKSLLSNIKEAIHSFIGKMKNHLINASNTMLTTIATSIIGPVIGAIKKLFMLTKQIGTTIKEAVNYIKSPENKGKPIDRLVLEIGKIVIAGLTTGGAIVLGEVIEKGLMTIPVLAIDIPLIGSLANIIGILAGALVAGIIGAITIKLIDKLIEKKRKAELSVEQIDKGNKILTMQSEMIYLNEKKLSYTKEQVTSTITKRHQEARNHIQDSMHLIFNDEVEVFDNKNDFDDMDSILNELLK